MSYNKATNILPTDLLEKVQEYVDGEYIYIPRISQNKKEWGAGTSTREELEVRNNQIYLIYFLLYFSRKNMFKIRFQLARNSSQKKTSL